MRTPEIESLFARTLLSDHEDEGAWAAVHTLRRTGSLEVFEHAAAWCQSDEPLKRARAAAILCQLQLPRLPDAPLKDVERVFRDESYALVTRMLVDEHDPMVPDLSYADHPDGGVRARVFPERSAPGRWSIEAHLGSDKDVRLGRLRARGAGCLDDPDEDVREEAAVGLGKRRDERLLPRLRTMLDAPELKLRVAEAAAALLGLDEDPTDWIAADYKAALKTRFNLAD